MIRIPFWSRPKQTVDLVEGQNSLTVEVATRKVADFVSEAFALPNPDIVMRKLGQTGMAAYRELLTDGRIGAAVDQLSNGVKSLGWGIQTGTGQEAHAEFCREMFDGYDMPRIIGELLNAALYGYQPMERIWKADGNHLIVADLVGKPQEWFCYSSTNELLFRKKGDPKGVPVEPYKFQVARHDADYLNPYGFPLMSRVFWPFVFKKGGVKFLATFCEKWGMPHAIAKVPPNTTDDKVAKYLEMLESLVQDGVAVIWDNAKIEMLETKTNSPGNLHQILLDWANGEIASALLGHESGSKSTPGKLGNDNVVQDVREDIIWARKNLVERELTLLIRDIIEVNFGTQKKYPLFKFFEEEDVDTTRADRDATLQEKVLAPMGKRLSPKYVREKHGLGEDDIEDIPAKPNDTSTKKDPATFAAPNADTEAAVKEAQATLQTLLDGISDADMQAFAQDAIGPVIAMCKECQSFDELNAKLAAMFPKMDTVRFEDALAQVVFLSETFGQMNDPGAAA